MREVYEIKMWQWDAERKEYVAQYKKFEMWHEAMACFYEIELSKDVPEVSLYKGTVDEYGCMEDLERMEVREHYGN